MKVLFFAQLRELLMTDELEIDDAVSTLGELRSLLQKKGEDWQRELQSGKALAAVNQVLADDAHSLSDNDEVAFFPPVTGG